MIPNELKYASLLGLVQRAIFCPVCKDILDVKKAVEVSLYHGDKLADIACVCGTCHDKRVRLLEEGVKKIDGARLEILDGREWD